MPSYTENYGSLNQREKEIIDKATNMHNDLREFCNQNVDEGYTVVVNFAATFLQNLSTRNPERRKLLTEKFVTDMYQAMLIDMHGTESRN